MKRETAEALDAMRRAIAKSFDVPESELVMTVNCRSEEVPETLSDPCEDGHDWTENLFGPGLVCELCGVKRENALVCLSEETPFDENNCCESCGHHEDIPLWYCPNCGEFVPMLPDSDDLSDAK